MDIPDAVLHFPSETSCIFKVNKAYSLPFIQGFLMQGIKREKSICVCVCMCVSNQLSTVLNKPTLRQTNQLSVISTTTNYSQFVSDFMTSHTLLGTKCYKCRQTCSLGAVIYLSKSIKVSGVHWKVKIML